MSDTADGSNPTAAAMRLGSALGIAAVERETGLAKDTLRVWERRYGFPQPLRDAQGERSYPDDQVQRLRLIRLLMDSGHRPRHVVALPRAELDALLAGRARKVAAGSAQGSWQQWQTELGWIRSADASMLRSEFARSLSRLGLARFVHEVVAPLTAAVGEAWLCGQLAVFEEHQYTEAMQAVLRQALAALPDPGPQARPRVLLTTFPGEPHGLGLLMAEALLALQDCRCTSLGVQTPLSQIVEAAATRGSDIVGLSFSACSATARIEQGLVELRNGLPPTVQLWAGGAAPLLHGRDWSGVQVFATLDGIAAAVDTWRTARKPGP